MPLIQKNAYRPPFYYLGNKHWQTIFPSLFRKIKGVNYRRERLELPDGDFLDLDFSEKGSKNLVVVLHGLEGNSMRHYVQGMVKLFNQNGFDALGYNCRSCSGEMNRLPRLYHHGDTPDLDFVLRHLFDKYEKIALVGFSLGGNIVLRYLGEQSANIHPKIVTAFAVSVPCHVPECAAIIESPENKAYKTKFLKKLSEKIRLKAQQHAQIDATKLEKVLSFHDFDNFYTAPLHGFASAWDYYNRVASGFVLDQIRIPFYLLSAKNDPLLTPACFPVELAQKSEWLHLEISPQGGHVGFELMGNEFNYAEKSALEWIKKFFLT